jgi:hypothetical protein
MDELMKAYLAGCIDCDGSISIKRSTYHMRALKDAGQPVYSERVMFKQVTPQVTELLKQYFGGYYRVERPSAKNGKPLYAWQTTDLQAIKCIEILMPYLRVKKAQAQLIRELRTLKNVPRIKVGTFTMRNRWGAEITIPRRIVDPQIILQKDILFSKIKALNDVRTTKPILI